MSVKRTPAQMSRLPSLRAFSAREDRWLRPGALPQAFTFRAFGAANTSFSHSLLLQFCIRRQQFSRLAHACSFMLKVSRNHPTCLEEPPCLSEVWRRSPAAALALFLIAA